MRKQEGSVSQTGGNILIIFTLNVLYFYYMLIAYLAERANQQQLRLTENLCLGHQQGLLNSGDIHLVKFGLMQTILSTSILK